MRIRYYNIFRYAAIVRLTLFVVLFVTIQPLYAQPLASKTLSRNVEKFKQYRTSDRAKAFDYANLVVASELYFTLWRYFL